MNRKMMLMLVALTLATLLLLVPFSARMGSASASAASATTLETAEQLYAQGDFALAAELYRQVVDQGYGDGDLYYNLGLAYHGAGDLGRALWSLRRAEALSPRDADIQTALASVRADLDASSAGIVAQSTGLARAMAATRLWVSTPELAVMALTLWVGLVSLVLVSLFSVNTRSKRRIRRLSVATGGALVIMLLLLGSRTLPETMLPAAIVVNDGVELRSGPGTEFGLQATMPAGAELRVVEARGDWVEVATDAGASGWAPADAVESF